MAYFCSPSKPKYLICIDPTKYKYMVINTDPYLLALPAQLKVTVQELPGLDHDSHIDTSKLVTLTAMETQNAVDADPRCYKGALSPTLRQSIKALIIKHGIMPKDQMATVAASF
jgi:hypothetical protein